MIKETIISIVKLIVGTLLIILSIPYLFKLSPNAFEVIINTKNPQAGGFIGIYIAIIIVLLLLGSFMFIWGILSIKNIIQNKKLMKEIDN